MALCFSELNHGCNKLNKIQNSNMYVKDNMMAKESLNQFLKLFLKLEISSLKEPIPFVDSANRATTKLVFESFPCQNLGKAQSKSNTPVIFAIHVDTWCLVSSDHLCISSNRVKG